MPEDHFICACSNCEQSIEFPVAMAGQTAECPACGVKTYLIAPESPPVLAPPVLAPPVLAATRPKARREKVWGMSAGGAVGFCIGLCMFSGTNPDGTPDSEMRLAGLALVVFSFLLTRKHLCSACKGRVDGEASVCRHCHSKLSG